MRLPLLVLWSRAWEWRREEREERRWVQWFLFKHRVRRLLRWLRGHDPDEVRVRW